MRRPPTCGAKDRKGWTRGVANLQELRPDPAWRLWLLSDRLNFSNGPTDVTDLFRGSTAGIVVEEPLGGAAG